MKTQTSYLKFQMEKEILLLGIQRVQGIIEKRTTAPIFSNILIEGSDQKSGRRGQISIVATDLEIGIRGTYPAQVQTAGRIAVSGKKLHEIIRELPGGDIDFTVEDGKFLIIKSGNSYFKIAGSNAEDFPTLPEADEERMLMIGTDTYGEMIKKTIFAVAEAEARQVLNGTLLEIEEEQDKKAKIRMVGTDGHRLSLCERIFEDNKGLLQGEAARQLIVPKKTLLELRRVIDVNEGIKIGIGEKQISFKGEDVYLTSRLIEGNYPNYKQVIPQEGGHTVRINRAQLISVIRRVSVMSREKTRAILLDLLPGKAVFKAKDPEIGEAREDIEVSYEGPGITVGLNYQYLLEAFEAIDDEEVILDMQSGLSPCIIKQESDPHFLCIVMPMRVQEVE